MLCSVSAVRDTAENPRETVMPTPTVNHLTTVEDYTMTVEGTKVPYVQASCACGRFVGMAWLTADDREWAVEQATEEAVGHQARFV
jgi:hypothetical protein